MSDRRRFLLASGALLVNQRLSFAQQKGRVYRLGWLGAGVRSEGYAVAFVSRLRELGFVEGRNLVIEYRTTKGRFEAYPAIAAELAGLNCDVLLAPGTEAALIATKQASRDTPIVVWANDYDPVATGHIASFARPGGRITGVSLQQSELPAKRVELLKETFPSATRIAVLSDTASQGQLTVALRAARALGLEVRVLAFERQPYDYEGAFAEAARFKAVALLALGSANFVPARKQIPALALKYRVPSLHHHSGWVQAGGLLSYGPNFSRSFRRVAEQVAMIFNGRSPADMPVEQPTELELVININTARALGLELPPSILARADRVIE